MNKTIKEGRRLKAHDCTIVALMCSLANSHVY